MDDGEQAIEFGPYRLLPARRLLLQGAAPVPLGSRAFDILVALVQGRSELVSKDTLMRQVWGGQIVEENTLAVHLSALRRALGDGRQGRRYIVTVPGRGYRFLQAVAPGGDGPRETAPVADTLPRGSGPLFGREAALAQVVAALRQALLVTVTGPGGVGKTRLASAVGAAVAADFPDGLCWVDLAPVQDAGLVAGTAARALGLQLGDSSVLPRLAAWLRGGKRLLILDNCEHVASGVAELVVALRSVESLRLLATSQQPLGLAGEWIERLAPLELPDSAAVELAAAQAAPAIQLFVARAQAAAQGFVLDEGNVAAVVETCRRLEGVPLALELAAARVALLGAEPVARRLDQRLLELSSGRRDVLPKHQTLRALLEWSCSLLTAAERIVLRRLAVFAGSCTLEAAEVVTADAAVPEWQVAEHVASLIAKSLVFTERTAQGARYRLLETTRAYARERLVDAEELPAAMRRHAEYLCRVFERADLVLEKMATSAWSVQWGPELDNLRAVLDWCFAAEAGISLGIALTAVSAQLWGRLGDEGRNRIDAAFARLDDEVPAATASALWLGKFWQAANQSDDDAMARTAETALALARRSQQPVRIVRAALAAETGRILQGEGAEEIGLWEEIRLLSLEHGYDKNLAAVETGIAIKYIRDDRPEAALAALHRAWKLNERVKDESIEGDVLAHFAQLHASLGQFVEALDWMRRSADFFQRIAELDLVEKCRAYELCLLILVGRVDEARDLLRRVADIAHDAMQNLAKSVCFIVFCIAAGSDEDAARLLGYADKAWPPLAQSRYLSGAICRRCREILAARGGADDLRRWSGEGEQLSQDQAIATALRGVAVFLGD